MGMSSHRPVSYTHLDVYKRQDHTRAEAAKKRAEEILARKDLDRREYEMAQARLKRALVRTSIKD